MKKIYHFLMAGAIALSTFTLLSCEDVPMPFNNPLDYQEEENNNTIEPTGDGTAENPFNVAGVLKYIETLEAGVESDKDVYVSGVVTAVKESFTKQYGNATFTMSDDDEGTNTFTFYRGLYLGNKKYSNESDINVNELDKVVICGRVMNYGGNTPETAQGKAYVVRINDITLSPDPEPTGAEAKGTGTQADPYNVAGVLKFIEGLGADNNSPSDVYVKGKVKEVKEQFGTQFGNATFTMVDEGYDAIFTAYRVLYLENKKYTEGDALTQGDDVIVCGKVVNFRGNTPETAQGSAYLYSLNGKTEAGGGNDTPSSDLGTKDAPLTVAKALDAINALADGGETETEAYVKGTISKVQSYSDKYKSITYYISDDGSETKELQIYSGKNIGGAEFASQEDLSVGDVVVVKGKLKKYMKNGEAIPEMNQPNEIVSITKGSNGDTPSPSTAGTKDNPYNITDALAAINALDDNGYSDAEVYVKGVVVKVTTNQANFEKYGNLNYLISEDGNDGTTITVYSGDGLNGAKFSGIDALKQGDKVIVYGKLQKYVKNDKVTPEIAKGNYLVSLNGKTE